MEKMKDFPNLSLVRGTKGNVDSFEAARDESSASRGGRESGARVVSGPLRAFVPAGRCGKAARRFPKPAAMPRPARPARPAHPDGRGGASAAAPARPGPHKGPAAG